MAAPRLICTSGSTDEVDDDDAAKIAQPQLARGFAEQLKAAIEVEAGAPPAAPAKGGMVAWIKALWHRIFG